MFNFLKDKLIKSKLKNLPQDQQDMIMKMMDENPELLKKISDEIKAKKKQGVDEQTASMQVMFKYKNELQKVMMPKK
jgi:hypothetical protein